MGQRQLERVSGKFIERNLDRSGGALAPLLPPSRERQQAWQDSQYPWTGLSTRGEKRDAPGFGAVVWCAFTRSPPASAGIGHDACSKFEASMLALPRIVRGPAEARARYRATSACFH
jgi:hypothetical protein